MQSKADILYWKGINNTVIIEAQNPRGKRRLFDIFSSADCRICQGLLL